MDPIIIIGTLTAVVVALTALVKAMIPLVAEIKKLWRTIRR